MISVSKRASVQAPMASREKTGIIEKKDLTTSYEETHVEWRIPDFFPISETADLYETYYNSPTFTINDASCYLRLYPRSSRNCEFMRLFINCNVNREYPPEYNINLKRLDGCMEYLVSGILEEKEQDKMCDIGDIIKRSKLQQRKSELAPQNVLTIICRLKRETNHSTESSDKTMPPKLISK